MKKRKKLLRKRKNARPNDRKVRQIKRKKTKYFSKVFRGKKYAKSNREIIVPASPRLFKWNDQ